MAKIEIDKNKELKPGDVVELHYNASGAFWVKATEAAMVEWQLDGNEIFDVINIDYMQPGKIIIKVQVKKTNPVIVTVLVICGAIAVVAVAVGWMFDKAYLVSETMPAQVVSVGLVIVLGALAVMYMRSSK